MKRQLVKGSNFEKTFFKHPNKCFVPSCFVGALGFTFNIYQDFNFMFDIQTKIQLLPLIKDGL